MDVKKSESIDSMIVRRPEERVKRKNQRREKKKRKKYVEGKERITEGRNQKEKNSIKY